jgi:pimeloyl-ACP methyl ester carboxylesterase
VVVLLALAAGHVSAQSTDAGRMVQAGQKRLYLRCEGVRHGPVVVLESGAGRTSADWRKVQPEVDTKTEVCSYDRAGLGQSGAGVAQQSSSAQETVEDLHGLLKSAGVRPPYVMVGHSAGGMLVREFEAEYPKDVVGMVLVDSADEEQIWRFRAIDPNSIHVPGGDAALAKHGFLPTGERSQWHDDIPLIVIEHGIPITASGPEAAWSAQFESAMQAMQKDLASRSKYGELRVAEHSGHDIELEQPEIVVKAIDDVLSEVAAQHR